MLTIEPCLIIFWQCRVYFLYLNHRERNSSCFLELIEKVVRYIGMYKIIINFYEVWLKSKAGC